MGDARKQIDDKLISPDRRWPRDYDYAKAKLRDKSVLICPDTNVLRRLVTFRKQDISNNDSFTHLKQLGYCLSNMHTWLLEIKTCKKLLNMNEVGWVIPHQIMREIGNYPNKFNELEDCRNSLKNAVKLLPRELQETASEVVKKIDELIKEAIKVRTHIVADLIILEEHLDHAGHAWQLVRDNEFPNEIEKIKGHDKQQMKDSIILCHLLDFHIKMGKPLIFWTFDTFGRPDEALAPSFFTRASSKYSIGIVYDVNKVLCGVEDKILTSKESKNMLGAWAWR